MCIGDCSSVRLYSSNAFCRRVSDAWLRYSLGMDQRRSVVHYSSSTQLSLHLLASCSLRLPNHHRHHHLYLHSCTFCYFLQSIQSINQHIAPPTVSRRRRLTMQLSIQKTRNTLDCDQSLCTPRALFSRLFLKICFLFFLCIPQVGDFDPAL